MEPDRPIPVSNKVDFSLSIVVPVYKEEGNILEFLKRITVLLAAITPEYEIIFCLDPSPDRTEVLILEARGKDPRIKLVRFSRRFGQPMATLAGLQYSSGDAVSEMIQRWSEGYEVVYAQRRTREGETWIKTVVAVAGYKLREVGGAYPLCALGKPVQTETVRLHRSSAFVSC